MEAAMQSEIADRIAAHQVAMGRLRAQSAVMTAAGAPLPQRPLVMLAVGDSWFDYPLSGNSLSFTGTDIIAHLKSLGTLNPMILNLSHFGDATRAILGLPKQQRILSALQDPRNWGDTGLPDAILFSGGGDDVVGDQFCIFLDYAMPGTMGLNAQRFGDALAGIRASYLDLFTFRDRYAPGVPVFAHSYDFPIPNGVHPSCAGPWLQPSLQFSGWNVSEGTAIVREALTRFKAMLNDLAADPAHNFTLIDTQNTLTASDWANELHPFTQGFGELANRFVAALRASFHGRI
jgi:hypothetical protein